MSSRGRWEACPSDGDPGGKGNSGANAELCLGPPGPEGSGRSPGGHPLGSWTLMVEAWVNTGIWALGPFWPQAQLATTGP